MGLKKLLTGAVIGLVSCGTFAESEWKSVGTTSGFLIAVDANSIKEVSDYSSQATHKVWSKHIIYNDLVQDGLAIGDYQMILYLVNCKSRSFGIKSLTTYTKQKNGIYKPETTSISYPKLDDAIPESIGEGIVDAVCS